jgi:hypothetical protein
MVKRILQIALVGSLTTAFACSEREEPPTGSDKDPPVPTQPVPLPDGRHVILVDPSIRYQTMLGWEATAEAGQTEISSFPRYRDQVVALAVDDLGLNRLRLEVRSGAEHPRDIWQEFSSGALSESQWRCLRYATVNDNADPNVVNASGFHFSEMDAAVESIVLPMKARLEARGERLYLNVNYVSFAQQCPGTPYAHGGAPNEYAEFVVATYDHLKSKYGLVPDAWEVILEPDNTSWNGTQIGQAVVAAGKRLAAAGYTPRFIAPSTTNMTRAVSFIDAMMDVPEAARYVSELSYHRYDGVSEASLDAIAQRARQHSVGAAMLEHIGSDYVDLHADLTRGGNTSWQQFTLAFDGSDDGDKYFVVSGGATPTVTPGARTKLLRQYFRFIRAGATRVGAASSGGGLDPVAFINTGGGAVVVVKTDGAASFRLTGLPAGNYGGSYATTSGASAELPGVTTQAGQGIDVTIPGKGVLTVYRR